MLQTIIAIERDGMDFRAISLSFDVPNQEFDLVSAVKSTALAYCKTEKGKAVYDYNCSHFNWADFDAVPAELCEQYGFHKVNTVLGDIIVDWDEQLVDDSELEEEETDELSE